MAKFHPALPSPPVTRRILITLIALTLVAAACGGDDSSDDAALAAGAIDEGEVTTAAYVQFRSQPTACGAERPESAHLFSFLGPADLELSGTVTATITTSCGDIVLELDSDIAPETVNSFVYLAKTGYFDGTVSHRVFPDFIIQAGDPTATGRGGPGYVVPDEFATAATPGVTEQVVDGRTFLVFESGTVAMANAGPGTTGSQFFIVLGEAFLPPTFTLFGKVVDGFDVLDRIERVPLTASGADPVPTTPLETVYIESVTIDE